MRVEHDTNQLEVDAQFSKWLLRGLGALALGTAIAAHEVVPTAAMTVVATTSFIAAHRVSN